MMSSITKISLFFLFLVLPLSQVKLPFVALPLYVSEVVALIVVLVSFIERRKFPNKFYFGSNLFVIGALLFFFGALLSFYSNPFSLMGLGMLKSWFIFPMLSAWLLLQAAHSDGDEKFYLSAWFLMILGVATASLFSLIHSELTYDARLQAMYTSPNFLAIILAPGILLAAFFSSSTRSLYQKYFFFATLLVLAVLLFFTHSYGVWFATFFSSMFIYGVSLDSRKKNLIFLILIVALAATFFVSEKDNEKWQSLVSLGERSSLTSRLMIWRASEKILEDNFFLGIGVGRFQEVYLQYQKYFPPYLEWAVPQPHNLYLAVLLQTGTLGFLGFVLMLYAYFSHLGKFILDFENEKRGLAVILSALALLYLLYGLFDTPYFKTDLAFHFWLLLALGFALQYKKGSSEEPLGEIQSSIR